ncbi:MAG: 2-C-methyl-D-erythritol 4-phosphate cytidylyltransferase [Halorhodospira sp.]
MSVRLWAVIPAAGVGRRMGGGDRPKQYRQLLDRPVIAWALERLLGHPRVAGAVVALAADDPYWEALRIQRGADQPVHRVDGGAERHDSVRAALAHLAAVADGDDRVLVHDAVRPCLSAAELDRLITEGGEAADGALLATPVRDTLKRADGAERVAETVPRDGLWQAQTPQLFPLGRLAEALDAALAAGAGVTDEAQAVERHGGRPRLVTGEPSNLKITHQADLELAAAVLAAQRAATGRDEGPA